MSAKKILPCACTHAQISLDESLFVRPLWEKKRDVQVYIPRTPTLLDHSCVCVCVQMDDAAIEATRALLREERAKLIQADDALSIELKALPLTTAEQVAKDEQERQKVVEEEQKRLKQEQADRNVKMGLSFFPVCIAIGLVLYIIGGVVATHNDSVCNMWGPVTPFIDPKIVHPAYCNNGWFTAGIVFMLIGLSPIIIGCALAAGGG